MSLLDRHLEFLAALREAGLAVSLAEGLDAVAAVRRIGYADRERLRAAYAATVVKRGGDRAPFDAVFDLYFPTAVGSGGGPGAAADVGDCGPAPGPQQVADFRDAVAAALADGDPETLGALARDAVDAFGRIPGRGQGEQRWSAYNVGSRVRADDLVAQALAGLGLAPGDDPAAERDVRDAVAAFDDQVAREVRRRAAEVSGPAHVARYSVRRSIEQIDFTAARRQDLDDMRRAIGPLARRLATRLRRRQRVHGRGALDFRRTIRAAMSTGGVPLATHQLPRRPARSDLVVLCDVSGSVAGFAGFTLLLVHALHEQFGRVRAFTFVDDVHEVSDLFRPGVDPAETLAMLAESARHASRWGRTDYGRAFTRFAHEHPRALTPRTHLLVLGDARSNYGDLALEVVQGLVHEARHAWWLNPEHARHWDTGDSAARAYGELMPMVECRNLTQLTAFVERLA